MEPFSVHLFGLITSMKYYKAKFVLETLQRKRPKLILRCITEALVESEWEEFVQLQKHKLRGEVWAFKDNIMVFVNKEYLGGCDSFHFWCSRELMFQIPKYPDCLLREATREMRAQLRYRKHVFVFLDVTVNETRLGSLVFELFSDLVPKTCANFVSLCTGEAVSPSTGKPISYKDSLFHRIVPGGWIQGGDNVYGTGEGGESIYGEFPDENFRVCHNRRGILGMANHGLHSNLSQFYITLDAARWMDTKFVAFGQLAFGYSLLQLMEETRTVNEVPLSLVLVSDCGVFDIGEMQLNDLRKWDTAIYLPDAKVTPELTMTVSMPIFQPLKDRSRRRRRDTIAC